MRRHLLVPIVVICFIYSCKPAVDKTQSSSLTYFDIRGYFASEISRLSSLRTPIKKTVGVNGDLETKSLVIKDWKSELSAFSDAEINRASWKGLFRAIKTDTSERFISNNEKVPVKDVMVKLRNGLPYSIKILIKNKNMLYTSVDTLTYISNKLYRINKSQDIRFLNNKAYLVEGKF
jgi:hypothetical protein